MDGHRCQNESKMSNKNKRNGDRVRCSSSERIDAIYITISTSLSLSVCLPVCPSVCVCVLSLPISHPMRNMTVKSCKTLRMITNDRKEWRKAG